MSPSMQRPAWNRLLLQIGITIALSASGTSGLTSSSSSSNLSNSSSRIYSNSSSYSKTSLSSSYTLSSSSSSTHSTSSVPSSLPSSLSSSNTTLLNSTSTSHKTNSSITLSITSTTKSNSTTTKSIPSSITSCAPPNLYAFLNSKLLSLSPSALESVIISEQVKLEEWLRTLARIGAATSYKDSTRVYSYLSSLNSALAADITSFYGPAGNAWLDFGGFTDGCLFTTCLVQWYEESLLFRSYFPTAPASDFNYVGFSPCCGQCRVTAQNVEILYWPTPAPTPATTALVDASINLTYVSPSAYAWFTSLSATDYCGPVGPYYWKTIGFKFPPGALSTSSYLVNPAYSVNPSIATFLDAPGQWTAINFADFDNGKCKCTTNCEYDPILEVYLTDICTPQLSIPAVVSQLDPLWEKCASDFGGVFDPPIALPGAPGLTLPKTTSQSPPSQGGSTITVGPTPAPVNSPTPTPPGPPITAPPSPINTPITTSSEPPGIIGFPLPSPITSTPTPLTASPITIGGIVLTPIPGSSSVFLVGTQTLLPGSVITLANGATISNSPAGTPVIVPGSAPTPTPITIGGIVLTPIPGSSSVFLVDSQTLLPGSVIILSNGATISNSPAGTPVIVPGAGAAVATPGVIPGSTTPASSPNLLTINGQPITGNPSGAFVVGSQTLVPGGTPITVSGTVISLASGGTVVVVGGTASTSLGSIIASVFSGTTPTTSAPAQYTGAAGKGVDAKRQKVMSVMVVAVLIALYV